jgi:hypothetical protein
MSVAGSSGGAIVLRLPGKFTSCFLFGKEDRMREYGAITGRTGAATVTALAWLAVGGQGAWGRVVTFDGLVPGSTNTTYTEDGYTFTPTGANIFVGSNFGPVTTAPYIFPSSIGADFHLAAPRPFALRSVDLGPLSTPSGPQTVTFTGTLAGGGTVSKTFTTAGTFGLQTFNLPATFTGLTSVDWDPASSILDNVVVEHGPVMTFSGIVPGSTGHTTYSENGFRLDATIMGEMFAGTGIPAAADDPYVFGSHLLTGFRFTEGGGKPFDLFGIDLAAPVNSAPRTVTFTGTLADGGTVSQSFTTTGASGLTPFYFGSEFSNLVSVEWSPGLVRFDSIEAGLYVPEPSSVALLSMAIGGAGLTNRRRRMA